jgi:hypothetical protein
MWCAHLSSQATWKTEIERIKVPGGVKFKRHISTEKNLGPKAHACHSRHSRKLKIGGLWFRLAWQKSETLSQR